MLTQRHTLALPFPGSEGHARILGRWTPHPSTRATNIFATGPAPEANARAGWKMGQPARVRPCKGMGDDNNRGSVSALGLVVDGFPLPSFSWFSQVTPVVATMGFDTAHLRVGLAGAHGKLAKRGESRRAREGCAVLC